jgi:hypothetical protein
MWNWNRTVKRREPRFMSRTAIALAAIALLLAISCDTEQVQLHFTPTVTSPGERAAPTIEPTKVLATGLSSPTETAVPSAVADTEASATPESIETPPSATVALPTSNAAPTLEPAPPPYHYLTSDEALEAAIELGCSGWASVTVNEISYLRLCADEELFESLTQGVETEPQSTISSDLRATVVPTTAPIQPTLVPVTQVPLDATPFIPTVGPTPTPPPYHFATEADAIAGANEIGCSGWTGRTVEGVGYYRSCSDNGDYEILSAGGTKTLSGEACTLDSDPTVRFSTAPTDLSQIASIVPAGSPSGGVIKPHSYFHNKDMSNGRNVRVPVYAVADSVLTSVAYYGTSVSTNEYLIFFDVTCEISFKYDHLSELAPKLAALAPQTPSQSSATIRTEKIELKAGELIGYSVGAGGQGAWDFGVYDLTHVNTFGNQERYDKGKMRQSIHTVCPYDYFTEPLKSQMYALLGTHDQRIVPNVVCTTTERDVLGAASGAWFDNLDFENFSDAKLSIAMLPGEIVAITGLGGDIRIDKGQPTWLDPELLTSTHCYTGDGRWFSIEIRAAGMELAIADGTGSCPASLPSNATVYYR